MGFTDGTENSRDSQFHYRSGKPLDGAEHRSINNPDSGSKEPTLAL